MPDNAPPPAAIAPLGFNHVVLNVHDLEESHRFWTELMGFTQVGELKATPDRPKPMNMRFYSGTVDGKHNHHDLALVERPEIEPAERWSMAKGNCAINHVAITYPDRESWLRQLEFLRSKDVDVKLRIDHGMTHSIYITDPNGYGVEVLYELPAEVWEHDIDGALNYAKAFPTDHLTDSTDYETTFG